MQDCTPGAHTGLAASSAEAHRLHSKHHLDECWPSHAAVQVIFHVTIHRKRLELPETCHPGFKSLCEACMSTESSERPRFTDVLARLDAL